MRQGNDQSVLAVKVARLYYYQGLTTEAIAQELNLSRPKISRLLTFARQNGLVEIRIHDPENSSQEIEHQIRKRYGIQHVKVVSVPPRSTEDEWLDRVATFTAGYLHHLIRSKMIVALAWGTTLDAISRKLTPKRCSDVEFVQLNGSGNISKFGDYYISDIYTRFAEKFGGIAHLFPVPAFFDYPETRRVMWKERSIRHLVELSAKADLLVYSIGAPDARIPSYVYVGGFLEKRDFSELQKAGVVGDIATVFFRSDGTYDKIPLNDRASGPNLSLFKRDKHALCVVSGLAKIRGLDAALRGKLMSELIVDEATARGLVEDTKEAKIRRGEDTKG